MSTSNPAAASVKRQRNRSIAIALSLGMLVVLFYAATMVRLGRNVTPVTPAATASDQRPG